MLLANLSEPKGNPLQLFANDAANGPFQTLIVNVRLEGFVDQTLVVAAATFINLGAKPLNDFVIEAYGDTGLARFGGNNRSPSGLGKIIFSFHMLCAPAW